MGEPAEANAEMSGNGGDPDQVGKRSPTVARRARVASAEQLALLSNVASLSFENGQSTEKIVTACGRLAGALEFRAAVFPHWGELAIRIDHASVPRYEILGCAPIGVDMRNVTAAIDIIDEVCDSRLDTEAARSALDTIAKFPPVSLTRLALLAAAGAAALGVIFGAAHLLSLALIAISASAGARLRRGCRDGPQSVRAALCAALLAGAIGAVAARLQFSSSRRLVAVGPSA